MLAGCLLATSGTCKSQPVSSQNTQPNQLHAASYVCAHRTWKQTAPAARRAAGQEHCRANRVGVKTQPRRRRRRSRSGWRPRSADIAAENGRAVCLWPCSPDVWFDLARRPPCAEHLRARIGAGAGDDLAARALRTRAHHLRTRTRARLSPAHLSMCPLPRRAFRILSAHRVPVAAAHGAFAGVAAGVFDKAVAAVPMQGLAEEVPHDAVVARAWAAAAQPSRESHQHDSQKCVGGAKRRSSVSRIRHKELKSGGLGAITVCEPSRVDAVAMAVPHLRHAEHPRAWVERRVRNHLAAAGRRGHGRCGWSRRHRLGRNRRAGVA